MLTVIGDLVEDVVIWPEGDARRGTDNPARITRSRGGSAANVAARAASIAPTRFIGRVGEDRLGSALSDELASTGVDVRVQRAGRTGTVVVVVDPSDGERTMYPDRAASAELGPVDPAWLDGTSLLHVPAYGFTSEPGASSILAAIETARIGGARLSIDVSAVTAVEHVGRDRFLGLLERLAPDVVLANADEAQVLGLPDRSAGGHVVVKDGPRPARIVSADGAVIEVPAHAVDVVRDTTGAGDAFAAGFLTAWSAGRSVVDACRRGHAVAAAVLGSPGAG